VGVHEADRAFGVHLHGLSISLGSLTLGKLRLEKGDLLLLLDEEFLSELSNNVAHLGGVVKTNRVFGELFEFAFESFNGFFIFLKLGASLGLSLSGGLGEFAERIF